MRLRPLALTLLLLCGCPDDSARRTCVLFGTPVSTPDGDVAIETLAPGDAVLCQGPDGVPTAGRVSAVLHARREGYLRLELAAGELQVTREHPIATPRGFVPAGELRVGASVLTRSGPQTLEAVVAVHEGCQVVDLSVTPHPTYFAADVLVHNKTPITGPEGRAAIERSRFEALETKVHEDGTERYVFAELTPEDVGAFSRADLESPTPEVVVAAAYAGFMRGEANWSETLPVVPEAELAPVLADYAAAPVVGLDLLSKTRGEGDDAPLRIRVRARLGGEAARAVEGDVVVVSVGGRRWLISELPALK